MIVCFFVINLLLIIGFVIHFQSIKALNELRKGMVSDVFELQEEFVKLEKRVTALEHRVVEGERSQVEMR